MIRATTNGRTADLPPSRPMLPKPDSAAPRIDWPERITAMVGRYPTACLTLGLLVGITLGYSLKRR